MDDLGKWAIGVILIGAGAAFIAHQQLVTANLWTTPFSTLGALSDVRTAGIACALVGVGMLVASVVRRKS